MNMIERHPLFMFQNMKEEDITKLLQYTNAYEKKYKKGATIYHAGDKQVLMGIVLEGSVEIIQIDFYGKESTYSNVKKGGIFGETYALIPTEAVMVDVVADENVTILFFDLTRLMQTKELFALQAIQNLIKMLARKNITLSRKITHITPRTIRARVLSYLQDECRKQNSLEVILPQRQKLADYLCVDRSALSNELSKLQKEGVLRKGEHKGNGTVCVTFLNV